MNAWRAWAAVVCTAALVGCATPRQAAPGTDSLSGRLAVKVEADGAQPARSVSAGFELEGNGSDGRLHLTSPLGTVVARAEWSDANARLITSEGETRYADLDQLTREMLGESLPVAALFDWLRGRPWPGAPSQALVTEPPEPGFEQLGWTVRLGRFEEGWVMAHRARAPQVTVRAKVE